MCLSWVVPILFVSWVAFGGLVATNAPIRILSGGPDKVLYKMSPYDDCKQRSFHAAWRGSGVLPWSQTGENGLQACLPIRLGRHGSVIKWPRYLQAELKVRCYGFLAVRGETQVVHCWSLLLSHGASPLWSGGLGCCFPISRSKTRGCPPTIVGSQCSIFLKRSSPVC